MNWLHKSTFVYMYMRQSSACHKQLVTSSTRTYVHVHVHVRTIMPLWSILPWSIPACMSCTCVVSFASAITWSWCWWWLWWSCDMAATVVIALSWWMWLWWSCIESFIASWNHIPSRINLCDSLKVQANQNSLKSLIMQQQKKTPQPSPHPHSNFSYEGRSNEFGPLVVPV